MGEESVHILAPNPGRVHTGSAPIPVRASVSDPGWVQAELAVDGIAVDTQVNPDQNAGEWVAEWTWEGANDGLHVLSVTARDADGESVLSSPVTVTVVPACELIFSTNRDGSYAVYSMQADGNDPTRLTDGVGTARQPAWGPDGTLTFVGETDEGQDVTIDAAMRAERNRNARHRNAASKPASSQQRNTLSRRSST